MWVLLATGKLINRMGEAVARDDICYWYNTDGGLSKVGGDTHMQEIEVMHLKSSLRQFEHESRSS